MTVTIPYRSFFQRFIRKLTIVLFIIIILVFALLFGKQGQENKIIAAAVSSILCALWAMAGAWRVVNEIHVDEHGVRVVGYALNTRWEKNFEIEKSRLEIRSFRYGRHNLKKDYYLHIASGNLYQDIYPHAGWGYKSTIKIFLEFTRLKGAPIAPDQKQHLEGLRKKIGESAWWTP